VDVAPARRVRVRFESRTSSGRTRLICRLDPDTDAAYASAVARVSGAVERSLGPEVHANRVASASIDPPRVRLRGWRIERAAFVRSAAVRFDAPLVLRADVATCYPSISPGAVADALAERDVRVPDARACADLLRRIGAAGVAGLPIGPAPSAVLANAVLAAADEALRRRGVAFLRWVDEWWVAVASDAAAASALRDLGRALSSRGLRLNAAKTRIVDARDARPGVAEYHRAADAHAVPGLPRQNAVLPLDGGVAARR
jgi:hypothetical protein